MQTISLVSHPSFPPAKVSAVDVEFWPRDNHLFIAYGVTGAENVVLPVDGTSGRQDGLWRSTCFELFARAPGQSSYREFNFAPLFRWAAYEFDDYREGMRLLPLSAEPHMVDSRIDDRGRDFPGLYQLDIVLDHAFLPPSGRLLGLSAIIEEKDGTKSYWALRHPPGKPDFHHRDCFALELPAPKAA